MKPEIKTFFDEATFTATHVVWDPETRNAAIVDSVKDYDPKSGRTRTTSADTVIAFVKAEGLGVEWVLETHVHADHLTGALKLNQMVGSRICYPALEELPCVDIGLREGETAMFLDRHEAQRAVGAGSGQE